MDKSIILFLDVVVDFLDSFVYFITSTTLAQYAILPSFEYGLHGFSVETVLHTTRNFTITFGMSFAITTSHPVESILVSNSQCLIVLDDLISF